VAKDQIQLTRCAIYTRNSTNIRLDQEVNSLVTQREISSAYIKSQQYKGWLELPDRYDDGGHSGSGLERPALARLMHDIEVGKVDMVVVYKIDRLTRSLFDFVRLVEIFDRRGIALVSVSQAFDTSDSMGKMILNVLLTFSQFERELIAERARDGIRTRKRHGKVHGGLPPFGYIATREGLQVDEREAEIVRFIFKRFLETRRYTSVMTEVREAGLQSSVKRLKSGDARGGKCLSAGTVYGILRNPIYVGEIRGEGENYKGEHLPIISPQTWNAAQAISAERKRRSPGSKNTDHFLADLLVDDLGRQMRLDLNWHRGKTYCAYVSSNAIWSQKEFRRAYRANADELDRLVLASVSEFLCDRRKLRAAIKNLPLRGEESARLTELGSQAAERLGATPGRHLEALFSALLYEVELAEEELTIGIRSLELSRYLEWSGKAAFRGRPADWPCSDGRYDLVVKARAIAAERWPALHIQVRDPSNSATPNPKLVNLIKSARNAQRLVEEHRDASVEELARMQHCRPTKFARLVRLNYLAPDIVTAILDGTQPPALRRHDLLMSNVPTDWAVQRKLYGFPSPERAIEPRKLYGRGMWPSCRPGETPEAES